MKGCLLDFGCGSKPYKNIFNVEKYIGVDIEVSGHDHKNENIDFYYDGKTLPFENETYDSAFSSEVLEHIFTPDAIISEISRVLKSGAYFLMTVPFVWDEHEVPYDYGRYSSFGIKFLLEQHNFEVVKISKTSHYIEVLFQMLNAYIFQILFPANKILKMLLVPFFIAPITITGMIISLILPKNKSFYHNNIVVARKK
ncbi:MAG: class I SAM-dependent methyltransferase [Candidatus Kapabacteria bacterium]|nr:class I SAM-dependent methyltransferase [Candidatus Kapabacteria bacterium]